MVIPGEASPQNLGLCSRGYGYARRGVAPESAATDAIVNDALVLPLPLPLPLVVPNL